MNALLASYFPS
jgi:hypothetical protein